jgi:zinc transport system ATP-binding protein
VFEDVSVELGGVTILNQVKARVPQGGSTAIVGPNGAGKTTLLLALLGEIPHRGTIRRACRADGGTLRIGYVPQRLAFDRGMPMTVAEFLAAGDQRLPLWFGVRRRWRERGRRLLAAVRAEALENRAIGVLSGGEIQRVLLALALAQEPDLLILDEPAAGVDMEGEQVFCELLESLRREKGFTQLMVSHDLSTVTHHATHVICLNRSVMAEGPPRDVLTRETLTAVFGLHMGLVDRRSLPDGNVACDASCCQEDDDHA